MHFHRCEFSCQRAEPMKKSSHKSQKTTYSDAGVDIEQADQVIRSLLPAMKRTANAGQIAPGLGFGAQYELPSGYSNPVLVSGTDGVGTKLKLAFELNRHDTIGIDLVAMCVNDVVVQGAKPLFFLDYFATGRLDSDVMRSVIKGIADGCEIAETALIGGETAEMPGMYADGEYDLAGFCVGIVEKSRIIDGSRIEDGNVIVGIASTGVHSNGFSLIRKLIADHSLSLNDQLDDRTYGEALLMPTQIYVKPLLRVIESVNVCGLAHITGGGLAGNVLRILPNHTAACIDKDSIPTLSVYNWIQSASNLSDEEMLQTFNCGVGMVVIAEKRREHKIHEILRSRSLKSFTIGEVTSASEPEPSIKWQ